MCERREIVGQDGGRICAWREPLRVQASGASFLFKTQEER